MSRPRNHATYTFEAAGLLDRGHRHLDGTEVQKTQPPGCPTNGIMRQCYIQTLEGEFIGMCNESSLTKTGRTAPYRDLAAEARDRRSISTRTPFRAL
jgi:hypothetical protein